MSRVKFYGCPGPFNFCEASDMVGELSSDASIPGAEVFSRVYDIWATATEYTFNLSRQTLTVTFFAFPEVTVGDLQELGKKIREELERVRHFGEEKEALELMSELLLSCRSVENEA